MALRQAARSVASLAARREGVAVRAFATNINQTFGLPPDTFKRKVRADPRLDRSPHRAAQPLVPLATQSARPEEP